jgi:2-oxoglutarate ferredoxin oxidoreductase subunit gamma
MQENTERIEFRLSGSGGQGIITAGIILAAAALNDGKNAIQSQSYGPEARGGASKAEVVISDSEIDYPKATMPKYVLCLTKEAYRFYGENAGEDIVVMVDSSIETAEGKKVLSAPIAETAAKEFKPMVANAIALGFVVGCTNVVSREAVRTALLERVPKGTEELNDNALSKGFEFAEAVNAS